MKIVNVVFILVIFAMYILWQFSSNPIIAKVGAFLMFTFIFFWNMYRTRNNKQGNKLDKKE